MSKKTGYLTEVHETQVCLLNLAIIRSKQMSFKMIPEWKVMLSGMNKWRNLDLSKMYVHSDPDYWEWIKLIGITLVRYG